MTTNIANLLDECDAAMVAAGALLWNENRDLVIQLNKLAVRCRVAIADAAEESKPDET